MNTSQNTDKPAEGGLPAASCSVSCPTSGPWIVGTGFVPPLGKDALGVLTADHKPGDMQESICVVSILDKAEPKDWANARLMASAPYMLKMHELIVGLADGFDDDGATGPRRPLSWESVGRMALDYSRAALRASGQNANVLAPADFERILS